MRIAEGLGGGGEWGGRSSSRGNRKCNGLRESQFGLFQTNQELQRSEQGRKNDEMTVKTQ